ncbi:lipopolysaccharide heptosyltransferase I [Chitinibacter bivalviorum]|uniref:Lipopolysaccharide heptosyltransferase 1 n=1 Tax=Chitinibacter bivalviorum TaxID=2739434 RepID=A0A7H9BQV3_9NEIS|nr:lipopolysaccharide heptosyltransferase I [Chitinibacter bivalviorum]QLG89614.1 lipopolysaccharide heptosyltransferase I [Chitinibacter bivalviorum]
MQRILISKITSLGDVLFALPMITDIRQHFPDVKIDWVVDESFAALPALHPAIDRVIGVPLRGIKKQKLMQASRNLLRAIGELRTEHYDVVLDCHGMIKSALLSKVAKAKHIIGPPNYRLGEQVSRHAYDRQVSPDATLPAVDWYRSYAGLALGYQVTGQPDFGLRPAPFQPEWLPQKPYVMCFHAASKVEKTWPIEAWEAVLKDLEDHGIAAVLPWGAPHEYEFAQALAVRLTRAVVAPKMTVGEIAGLIDRALWVIGVDTGMTHLAESLNKPTIALYTVTDSATYHPAWNPQAHSLGGNGQIPSVDAVLDLIGR